METLYGKRSHRIKTNKNSSYSSHCFFNIYLPSLLHLNIFIELYSYDSSSLGDRTFSKYLAVVGGHGAKTFINAPSRSPISCFTLGFRPHRVSFSRSHDSSAFKARLLGKSVWEIQMQQMYIMQYKLMRLLTE